jgi:hypothetical protein
MSAKRTLPLFLPFSLFVLLFIAMVNLQDAAAQERMLAPTTPDACPVQLSDIHPASTFFSLGLALRVKNVANKEIVGLVFDAALADAAENWKWLHWNYDQTRPLLDFDWNKPIRPSEAKKLSWSSDLDFQHGGGGALVLTSILFADGSGWQAHDDNSTCKIVWHSHKKSSLVRPVDLPPRQ